MGPVQSVGFVPADLGQPVCESRRLKWKQSTHTHAHPRHTRIFIHFSAGGTMCLRSGASSLTIML